MNTGIDWSFWSNIALGIIGIVATIVFGIWAVLLVKKPGYAGRIEHYDEPPIWLFHDVARNLKNLKVLYCDKETGQNLAIIRGYIINTGHKDIVPEMISEPISYMLKEGYRFLEAKLSSPSVAGIAVTIVSPNKIELTFGLFKREEFIRFEALIEAPKDGPRFISLTIRDRITDTELVARGLLPPPITPKRMPQRIEKGIQYLQPATFLAMISAWGWGEFRHDHSMPWGPLSLLIITIGMFGFVTFIQIRFTKKRAKIWRIIKRFEGGSENKSN